MSVDTSWKKRVVSLAEKDFQVGSVLPEDLMMHGSA